MRQKRSMQKRLIVGRVARMECDKRIRKGAVVRIIGKIQDFICKRRFGGEVNGVVVATAIANLTGATNPRRKKGLESPTWIDCTGWCRAVDKGCTFRSRLSSFGGAQHA